LSANKDATMVKLALLVRLEAKPGKEGEVAKFLESALPLAQQEATAPIWFALRLGAFYFRQLRCVRQRGGSKSPLGRAYSRSIDGKRDCPAGEASAD